MLEQVKTRLASFGYPVSTSDEELINLLIGKVAAEIKLNCNISEVSGEAEPLVIDIITGEFLRHKKAIGADLGEINLEAVAKSIRLGDTTVDFGSGSSPETRFSALVNTLIDGNKALLTAALRRLDWS
jgi:hypothetical protein